MPTLWLPFVSPGGPVVPRDPPPDPPDPPDPPPVESYCDIPDEAQELLDLLRKHPEQDRSTLVCHAILWEVAKNRALDMLERNYFDHTDPDGVTPNEHLEKSGYRNWYPKPGNSIESIAAGHESAEEAMAGFYESLSHRVHLLGLDPFFSGQINIGVWYARSDEYKYRHVWVVVTAHPEDF